MAIRMRRVTEAVIQPKQVKEIHLDDGVISDRVMGDNAVDTDHLKDSVVTLAKAANDVRLHQFVGEESEVHVYDTSWTVIKVAAFIKHVQSPLTAMRFFGTLKVGAAGTCGWIGVFIDSEPEPRFEAQETGITYNLHSGEFDVSGLATGRHDVGMYLKTAVAGVTVSNDHVDIMFVK